MAREPSQRSFDLVDLALERVDHPQGDGDPLTSVSRKPQAVEELAALGARDLARGAGADPVVIEHRSDSEQPLGALIDQRLAQMQTRAPLADVLRSDPRLRQPALSQQLAQPHRVLAIGLGATLTTPQRSGLDRLGQVRDTARTGHRLGDE